MKKDARLSSRSNQSLIVSKELTGTCPAIEDSNSPYIEKILQSVIKCEEDISNEEIGVLPKYVTNIVLFHLITVLSKAILRGYSAVKKCTEEGRKNMEKDIKSLKNDLTIYTGKDLPCFDEILMYLQQYYYYPEKILKFVRVNPQFEISHIMGLVNTAPEIKKLKKNEIKNIVSRIEDFYVEYLSSQG